MERGHRRTRGRGDLRCRVVGHRGSYRCSHGTSDRKLTSSASTQPRSRDVGSAPRTPVPPGSGTNPAPDRRPPHTSPSAREYRRLMPERRIVVPPEHLFPADEWRIVEARWTPEYAARAETAFALSNGYLGVRGTLRRGPPGVGAGHVRQRLPRDVADHPRRGGLRAGPRRPDDRQRARRQPSSSCSSTTSRCSSRRPGLPEYLRVLDMRNGILTRELVWATPSGKHVRVRSTPAGVVRAPPRAGRRPSR